MLADGFSWPERVLLWARAYDLPNWFAVAFTAVLWPATLLLWHRRKINSVPGLEVHFADGQINIGNTPHSAIDIQVINHTGSVVYLSGARVLRRSAKFPVPLDATRDIAQDSYMLSFMDDGGQFNRREVTLQTNGAAKTCMPALQKMDERFFAYTAPLYRRTLRLRKYFVLEYTAMVGTTRFSVATLF